MTAEEMRAALTAVLAEVPELDAEFVADRILPTVRGIVAGELRAAVDRVRSVYDMQCPVRPASDYMDAGAYHAHKWWQTVLGGTLERLTARAAALGPTS